MSLSSWRATGWVSHRELERGCRGCIFQALLQWPACYFCARRRGRSVARRSSCVARALRGGLWWRRFCQSGRRARRPSRSSCVAGRSVAAAAFLPISKPRAFRGGLWRRGRSVARRSSCVAGRSVARRSSCVAGRSVAAAAFLPISKPRGRARCGAVCGGGVFANQQVALVAGRSVAAACLPISKSRSLRGGLWRRRVCQSASRARCGAVCGGGAFANQQAARALVAGRSVAAGAVCGEKKK